MNEHSHQGSGSGQLTDDEHATSEIEVGISSGPWIIELIAGEGRHIKRRVRAGERILLGSCHDADLRIDDAWVSARHCVLDASHGSELWLADLDSKNGVFIGNVRIKSARFGMRPTTFTIGKTSVVVRPFRGEPSEEATDAIDGLEGRSEPMLRLKREVRRLAKLRAPVLIVGETGSGKDVVARALHGLSGRRGAYVPLNVATIPDNLADSELFGHVKGSFTGAHQARMGAFEQAHDGTLFLDEIGELAPQIQAKMLRVLEDGIVRPVGATDGRKVDVRVVSATWASLSERCAAGRFRFDLLQRLSMVIVAVPPLRERRSDIPILAEHLLRRYDAEFGPKHLSSDALERLSAHDWPGNVRELGGALYRACTWTDGDTIDVHGVSRALATLGHCDSRAGHDPIELVSRAGGNVSEAARLAGLPRTTFRHWLGRAKRPATGK